MSRDRSSHIDESGRARMVDVGAKPVTQREAIARGRVRLSPAAFRAAVEGSAKKGDVLGVARIAGIQAAKRTAEWIPLAHPLPLESVEIEFHLQQEVPAIEVEATVRVTAKTGVEREALVAVSAAALTLYDMCKSIDRGMVIEDVRLLRKSGGKSGLYEADGD
ncbi:MAG: cyclic pyranopterin monophosphate synthase MoaC [Deltaproteobacteria bacterium]|nr:cyclic pyranopterin monophosphate synthase MoaC [Deltaproteobacteria bacterium]